MNANNISGVLRVIVVVSLISMLSVFAFMAVVSMGASIKTNENSVMSKAITSQIASEPSSSKNPDYTLTLNADDHSEWWFIYNDSAMTTILGGYWGSEKDLVIPSNVLHSGKNYVVTGVNGSNSLSSKGFTSLKMPNTIVSIGQGAFSDNNLASVSLSNNLATIGDFAFTQNRIKGSVTIPDGIKKIGYDSFSHNQISSVYLGNGVTSISDFAFYDNALKHIYLPDQLQSVGVQSFGDNDLIDVSVHDSSNVGDSILSKGTMLIRR